MNDYNEIAKKEIKKYKIKNPRNIISKNNDYINIIYPDIGCEISVKRGIRINNNYEGKKIQQDAHIVFSEDNIIIIGLFDGHGDKGANISFWLKQHFPLIIKNNLLNIKEHDISESTIKNAIIKSYEDADNKLYDIWYNSKYKFFSGSTAITVIYFNSYLIFANIGDSIAIGFYDHDETPIIYTQIHRADNETEAKRVIDAGGKIVSVEGVKRVNSMLIPTRAFGNFEKNFKIQPGSFTKLINPPIISIPDISIIIPKNDIYCVLTSDGYWDIKYEEYDFNLASKLFIEDIKTHLKTSQLSNLCNVLLSELKAKNDDSYIDNVTLLIFKLSILNKSNQIKKIQNVLNTIYPPHLKYAFESKTVPSSPPPPLPITPPMQKILDPLQKIPSESTIPLPIEQFNIFSWWNSFKNETDKSIIDLIKKT